LIAMSLRRVALNLLARALPPCRAKSDLSFLISSASMGVNNTPCKKDEPILFVKVLHTLQAR
jgi:hypothetical protein